MPGCTNHFGPCCLDKSVTVPSYESFSRLFETMRPVALIHEQSDNVGRGGKADGVGRWGRGSRGDGREGRGKGEQANEPPKHNQASEPPKHNQANGPPQNKLKNKK